MNSGCLSKLGCVEQAVRTPDIQCSNTGRHTPHERFVLICLRRNIYYNFSMVRCTVVECLNTSSLCKVYPEIKR